MYKLVYFCNYIWWRKLKQTTELCQKSWFLVHDRLQSFVLPSYTMYDLRNQNISIDKFLGQ